MMKLRVSKTDQASSFSCCVKTSTDLLSSKKHANHLLVRFYRFSSFDDVVKRPEFAFYVIPSKAEIF
jgi:hypothetical protein